MWCRTFDFLRPNGLKPRREEAVGPRGLSARRHMILRLRAAGLPGETSTGKIVRATLLSSSIINLLPKGRCAGNAPQYDPRGERSPKIAQACFFEGEQATRIQGENYAPLAAAILPSCLIRSSAFPGDRFSDSILDPTGHEFIRHKQRQSARQSELHKQRHVCE